MDIRERFYIEKKTELHALDLIGGRGYEVSFPGEAGRHKLPKHQRPAIYETMVRAIPGPGIHVLSVGRKGADPAATYAHLLVELQQWAEAEDTYIFLMYDGKELGRGEGPEAQDAILRNHAVLRDLHRELPIQTRRIIEDVVTKDSRYSQFVQAADLLAYGTFYYDVWRNPDRWSKQSQEAQAGRYRVEMTRTYADLLTRFEDMPTFRWFD